MKLLKRIKLLLRLSRNDRSRRRYNLGAYSYFGTGTRVYDSKIGKYCSIGDNCVLGAGDHPLHLISTSCFTYLKDKIDRKMTARYFDVDADNLYDTNKLYKEPVKIGNDVWIGHNVLIRRGVSIGDGAVIGMGAIVVKDVPPYAIVAGVPAKIIKYRFDDETIDKLLQLKWWDFPEDIVKKLPFADIKGCIKMLENNITKRKYSL